MTAGRPALPGELSGPDGGELDDAAIIGLSLTEPERFELLFQRHAPVIQRYVMRRLGADAADDIVAETFLLAFRQRVGYDSTRGGVLPWLYGIATNLLSRHRRDEIRLYKALARTGIDEVIAPFTDQVDERVTATAASRRLAEALAGQKITKGDKAPSVVVVPTPPFSWYTVQSTAPRDMVPDTMPRLSEIAQQSQLDFLQTSQKRLCLTAGRVARRWSG